MTFLQGVGEIYEKEGLVPLLDTLYIKLSFKGEGGIGYKREASPLFDYPLKERVKRLFSKGIERGEAPFRNSLPSPLMKGRGIKGKGLANN